MYEQDRQWNMYYMEIEPARRREMQKELLMKLPDDGSNEMRVFLFERRHTDPKEPKRELDIFLWNCVSFCQVYKGSRFFKKGGRKEILLALKKMGWEEAKAAGEAGERAFYWEIRNVVKRYYFTCTDKSYRRRLFGLMGANDEDRSRQVLKDSWEMSRGAAARLGLEEEMRIWCEAVRDEYACLDAGAAQRFFEYGQKQA